MKAVVHSELLALVTTCYPCPVTRQREARINVTTSNLSHLGCCKLTPPLVTPLCTSNLTGDRRYQGQCRVYCLQYLRLTMTAPRNSVRWHLGIHMLMNTSRRIYERPPADSHGRQPSDGGLGCVWQRRA